MKRYLKLSVWATLLFFAKSGFSQDARKSVREIMEGAKTRLDYRSHMNSHGRIIVTPIKWYLEPEYGYSIDSLDLYYTLDGSEPTVYSQKGKGLIVLLEKPLEYEVEVTLKTLFVDRNGNKSPINVYKYKFASRKIVDYYIAKIDSAYYAEKEVLDSVAEKISKTAKSDFEKIKSAYDWVIRTMQYDYERITSEYKYKSSGRPAAERYSNSEYYVCQSMTVYARATSSMYQNKGVCEDYTNLLGKLLDRLSIKNLYIWGECIDGTYIGDTPDHAWNLVKLNNKWYHCDATWDDTGGKENNPYYKYFLVSDAVMKITRKKWYARYSDKPMPTCLESYNTSGMTKQLSE